MPLLGNDLNITEMFTPLGNCPTVPISFKPAPYGTCNPPVSPNHDWPQSIYGNHVCCKGSPQSNYWSLRIHKQKYSQGAITTVCEGWFKKFFPAQYVLTTMDTECSSEGYQGKVEYVPTFTIRKIDRPICHSCHIEESLFTVYSKKNNTGLWEDGFGAIKTMCLGCLYKHFLYKNLFSSYHFKILNFLFPRSSSSPDSKPDVSRHYAKNAYGPVEIAEDELNFHRKELPQKESYLMRVYGFSSSRELFGLDPISDLEDDDD